MNRRKIMNTKANSPVAVAIILIAVTVAVSIAVAAWMGALTFNFLNPEYHTITVEVPNYDNATLAQAWIISSNGYGSTINDTHGIVAFPISLTASTAYDTATLKVDYYSIIDYAQGMYQEKFLGHEEYILNVTELQMKKP